MNIRLTLLIVLVMSAHCHADIFRWDNGELIPGTEGIEPGPGAELSGLNLRYADLRNADLSYAALVNTDLEFADLTNADLSAAGHLLDRGSDLTGANLRQAILTNVHLRNATLTDADLSESSINGARLHSITGFTEEQLYSTASYQEKDLRGVQFGLEYPGFPFFAGLGNDLSGWDFRGQDLREASFARTALNDADFTDAVIAGASFERAVLTAEQMYSTFSYKSRNLRGVHFPWTDMSGWNLKHQDLRNANFFSTGTDLGGADIRNAGGYLEDFTFDQTTTYNQWTPFAENFDPIAAELTFIPSPIGDFDADDALEVDDVDALMSLVAGRILMRSGHWPHRMFDLNGDFAIDQLDLSSWVHDAKQTYFGDANLNGEFDSSDLVAVFSAGEYEDGVEDSSNWGEGDWNADGDFTSSDIVIAFADGGYEQGPRVNAVPEPSSAAQLVLGLLALVRRRK